MNARQDHLIDKFKKDQLQFKVLFQVLFYLQENKYVL